jgi:hypothetical protein
MLFLLSCQKFAAEPHAQSWQDERDPSSVDYFWNETILIVGGAISGALFWRLFLAYGTISVHLPYAVSHVGRACDCHAETEQLWSSRRSSRRLGERSSKRASRKLRGTPRPRAHPRRLLLCRNVPEWYRVSSLPPGRLLRSLRRSRCNGMSEVDG